MAVIEAGDQIFSYADKHSLNVKQMLATPGFGGNPADAAVLNYEIQMMTAMWQLASSVMKDLTEPLKSIVNK